MYKPNSKIVYFQEMANTLKSAPGKLHPLKCDVRKESDVKEAFKWVKSKLGGTDIQVNNAGVADYNTLIGERTRVPGINHLYSVIYIYSGIALSGQ
jgi:NAD(P)-dependent dehydrogenase (short-subunit alcohol dehydrogenase family)